MSTIKATFFSVGCACWPPTEKMTFQTLLRDNRQGLEVPCSTNLVEFFSAFFLSSTFHVHAALKLAPILPQKSQEMQVVGKRKNKHGYPYFSS